MQKGKGFRMMGGPLAIAALGVVAATASGCSDAAPGDLGNCAAEISVKAEAFQASVAALVKVSGEMKASLHAACRAIASDLGEMPAAAADPTKPTDNEVTTTCNMASAAIKAEIMASGEIAVTIEGGRCTVNAQAQFDCEAKCDVKGECQPGSVEVRCTPGELSVSCMGSCAAMATCQGSAEVAANCQGTCSGTCTGMCSGKCSGTCMGTCMGTCNGMNSTGMCAGTCEGTCMGGECQGSCEANCTGKCTGECKLTGSADFDCGAMARCKGECKGTATAPQCEGEVRPPSCMLDADCQAGCEGQASFNATCTPPKVKIIGSGDATLTTTLEANLPKILDVAAKAEVAATAAVDVAGAAVDVGVEVAGAAGCAIKFGADFAAKMSAAAEASVSVNVSVMASGSVAGST
jgi:hypothetical protein